MRIEKWTVPSSYIHGGTFEGKEHYRIEYKLERHVNLLIIYNILRD
jgi:hypothetical protein